MRIAMLSTFYPLRGGIAQFNASLYHALANEGHEVKAFTFKRQYPGFLFPGQTQYITPEDKADPIPSEEILDTMNPFSYYRTASIIKAWKPDLLLMKYWMSYFGPSLGTVAKKVKRVAKVVTILDNVIPHEKRIVDKPFTKYFLRQNNGFVVMSDSVRDDLLSLMPGAKYLRKDHPLYDHFGEGLPREVARQSLRLHPEKKTLLFFGFIRDYKGLDLLIDAFAQLDESYQLVIAGEVYGSFDKYAAQINANPRKADIHIFTQYIPDHEVARYFCAADVCVLPYKDATQSGITSISFHFVTPLIATNVGGLAENITPYNTGMIVERPEPALIADTVRKFFTGDQPRLFAQNILQLKDKNSWASLARDVVSFSDTL